MREIKEIFQPKTGLHAKLANLATGWMNFWVNFKIKRGWIAKEKNNR